MGMWLKKKISKNQIVKNEKEQKEGEISMGCKKKGGKKPKG